MAKKKRYVDMTTEELAEATKEFDVPNPKPKPVRISRAAKAKHDRILALARKRAGGPPRFSRQRENGKPPRQTTRAPTPRSR